MNKALIHQPHMSLVLHHMHKSNICQHHKHLFLLIAARHTQLHHIALLFIQLQLKLKTQISIIPLTPLHSLIKILLIKLHRIRLRKKIILVLMEVVKPTMIANKDNVKLNI